MTSDDISNINNELKITFTTDVIDSIGFNESQIYQNTATIQEGDFSYSDSSSVEYHDKAAINKDYSGISNETNDGAQYKWTVQLHLPNDNDLSSYVYEDQLTSNVTDGSIVHYISNENDFDLTITNQDGSSVSQSYSIIYIDQNQNEYETFPDDSDVIITGFKIQFESEKLTDVTDLTLTYNTRADYTMDAGNTYSYINTGIIHVNEDKYEASSSHDYYKEKAIEKFGGTYDGNSTWTNISGLKDENGIAYKPYKADYVSEDLQLEYINTDGHLYYMIVIRPGTTGSGDIVIEDLLPSGTSLIMEGEFKPFLAYYYGQYTGLADYSTTNSSNNEVVYLNDEGMLNVEDQDGKITFTIDEKIWNYQDISQKGIPLALCYVLELDDEITGAEKVTSYINHVAWNGNTDTQTQTVHKDAQYTSKIGQLKEETKYVNYSIIINPAAEDLSSDSDYLTLTDQMTYNSNQVESISFVQGSLKVYAYDMINKTKGDEINSELYSYTYDSSTKILKVQLPDSMACVIEYQYYVSTNTLSSVTLTNTAILEGVANSKSEDNTEFKESDSSADIHKNKIYFYKVDSQNYNIKLSGAEFSLYKYEDNNWTLIKENLKTDDNGEISLNINNDIQNNILYKLDETSAPEGYSTGEPTYFIVTDTSQDDEVYQSISSVLESENIKESEVNIIRNSGTIYIPNDYTSITAKKIWVDSDGTEITAPEEEIKLQLKQSVVTKEEQIEEYYTVTVTAYNYNVEGNYETREYQVKQGTEFVLKCTWTQSDWYYTINDGEEKEATDSITVNKECKIYLDFYEKYENDWANLWKNIETTYTEPEKTVIDIISETKDYNDSVTLDRSNNWQYTWNNLPRSETDSNGNEIEYVYSVEEVDVPSGWVVSYNGNNIQNGNIIVINRKQESTSELPVTGGKGYLPFVLGGILSMSVAVFYFVKKKSSSKEGGF